MIAAIFGSVSSLVKLFSQILCVLRKNPWISWILWYLFIEDILRIGLDLANLQNTIPRTYLKTCYLKVQCTKQLFCKQFEVFFRNLRLLMASRLLGEHLRTHCVQKVFIEAFKYQKYDYFSKLPQNRPFLSIALLIANFWNKRDCKPDKNLKNLSFH